MNRVPTPNQVPARVDGQLGQGVPQSFPSASEIRTQQQSQPSEVAVQARVAPSVTTHNNPVTSMAIANTSTTAKLTSNLDGALGPIQQKSNNSSDSMLAPSAQVNTSTQPFASRNTSATLVAPHDSSVKKNLPEAPSSSSSVNPVSRATPATPAAQQRPTSSGVGTHNLPASPMRTPKEADKKHLARDILRALKRPRPESSVSQGPEPKRHAPEVTAAKSAIVQPTPQASSSPSLITARPIPSTSTSTHPVSIHKIPTLPVSTQSSTPNVTVPSNSRPYNPPPSGSTTATPPTLPTAQQNAPAPTASSSTSTQAPAATAQNREAIPVLLENYPNVSGTQTLNSQDIAKVNQAPSFGHSSGQFHYGTLSGGDNVPRKPPPPPAPFPSKSQPIVVTVVPAARVPLQVLQFKPIQTPDQPGPSSQPPSPNQAKPQAPSSSLLVESAPTPVSISSNPRGIVKEGLDGARADRDSVATSGEKVAESRKITPPMVLPQGNKTPLFLPSPTSSPHLDTASAKIEEVTELVLLGKKGKGKGKAVDPSSSLSPPLPPVAKGIPSGSRTVSAYVLVPPLPDYAKRWKRQQSSDVEIDAVEQELGDLGVVSRSRSLSLGDYTGPPRSPSVSSAPPEVMNLVDDEESSDTAEESNSWSLYFASYDDAEKEALRENCAILRETLCKWQECETELNSLGALIRHFNVCHGPRRINPESPWTCEWTGCGYTSISREDYHQHIERHAVYPLWCPFTGCNEVFRTPRQLIRHKRSDHSNELVRRRTVEPLIIRNRSLIPIPPTLPKILPVYTIEYDYIRPASITRHRHEILMPSVLRRISGNVPTQLHSYNAARPMPPTPSAKDTFNAPAPANTPYSFLENRSTRYSSYLSTPARSRNFQSLGSSYTTNLVKRGLVLWPEKEGAAIRDEMIEELEGMEEDAVEKELLDGDEDDVDVFGPTIKIETPGSGASGGDVGRGGVSGGSGTPTNGGTASRVSAKR